MSPRLQEAKLRHASHYKNVLKEANDLYRGGKEKILAGVQLYDLEWENIRMGQTCVASAPGQNRALSELCLAYSEAGADILLLRQYPKERIEWLETALSAARENGDRPGEGRTLGNLGTAYTDLGEARKAIEFHERALVIEREIGDRLGEGTVFGNLGTAYHSLGNVRKAIDLYEQQLVVISEIGDRRLEGRALSNLGSAYNDLRELHKAIEFHERALVIEREIGDREGEGAVLGNLGNAYKDLGEASKAIEFHEQALVVEREIGDRVGEGQTLFNMGFALYGQEEKYRAVNLVKQALEIFEAIESPYAAQARKALQIWGIRQSEVTSQSEKSWNRRQFDATMNVIKHTRMNMGMDTSQQNEDTGKSSAWADFLRWIRHKFGK